MDKIFAALLMMVILHFISTVWMIWRDAHQLKREGLEQDLRHNLKVSQTNTEMYMKACEHAQTHIQSLVEENKKLEERLVKLSSEKSSTFVKEMGLEINSTSKPSKDEVSS